MLKAAKIESNMSKFPDRAPTYLLLPLGKRGLFNHEKGTFWQSYLAAQKEGVVSTIIFSNHKTYQLDL